MVIPPNKKVSTGFAGQKVMDFFTITTSLEIGTGDAGTLPQERLNKLIETVSQRGQPLIIEVSDDGEGSYTLKLAMDHYLGWADGPTLAAAIDGLFTDVSGDVPFSTSGNTPNTTVVHNSGL